MKAGVDGMAVRGVDAGAVSVGDCAAVMRRWAKGGVDAGGRDELLERMAGGAGLEVVQSRRVCFLGIYGG